MDAEHNAQILAERVKMAEEQAHNLTRRKMETEEEIRRVRASAVKVSSIKSKRIVLKIEFVRVKRRRWPWNVK